VPRDRYVAQLINEMIPRVAEEELAEFCDVYCDEGYYTVEESRRILEAGRAAGLKLKIHTDAYSAIGGAAMAAELGVVSADHLNHATREDFRRLAEAGVTGVVMPALDWAVQHARPFDARAMLAEGLPLALATDLCPACWVESMQVVMQLACRMYRLSPEEALYAATAGGARALGLEDRGTLQPGRLADVQIWDLPSLEDLIYRLGHNAVETVIKRGRIQTFEVLQTSKVSPSQRDGIVGVDECRDDVAHPADYSDGDLVGQAEGLETGGTQHELDALLL
jgi:imidazolonepropionase